MFFVSMPFSFCYYIICSNRLNIVPGVCRPKDVINF